MLCFTISSTHHCRRFESYLGMLLPAAPLSYVRKLIRSGSVQRNGCNVAGEDLVLVGDEITLKESATVRTLLATTLVPALDILFENEQLVVVNKPAGLAMHRTAEDDDDLVAMGTEYMRVRQTPCKLYPVNRLDRGTSGAVILAKSSTAAGIYGRQVKETGLDKLYLALVEGVPPVSGMINEPLDGKESETRFTLLESGKHCTLLAVTPVTGRMHQIRRHFSAIGHPVLGDVRYQGVPLPDYAGIALHSFCTVVERPEGEPVSVTAPLPHGLIEICGSQGIEENVVLTAVRRLLEATP